MYYLPIPTTVWWTAGHSAAAAAAAGGAAAVAAAGNFTGYHLSFSLFLNLISNIVI
jgi:hypothetical protein